MVSRLRSLFTKGKYLARTHPKKSMALIMFILIVVGFFVTKDEKKEELDEVRIPQVKVSTVGVLSMDTEPLVLLGEVRSVSQAELRAQKPGEVTMVYVKSGQFVGAGTILAEISNQSERAAVLSAQGILAAAQAQHAKLLAGARMEDKTSSVVQAGAAGIALESAKDSARSAYSQAYTLAQDALFAQADDFFSNAYTVDPSFRVRSASYDESQDIEKQRVILGDKLEAWKEKTLKPIVDEDLDVHLKEAQADLDSLKQFLNTISTFVSKQNVDNDYTSTDKSSDEGVILGARGSIDSARGIVNGARSSLASAESGSTVASLSESVVTGSARSEDIAASEASVTQARGALLSAQAALENTFIRTPISGTVSTLSVARGDFVNTYESVAVVANEGALEVEVFVSDAAKDRIAVGTQALVSGTYTGVVTSVAPGLDPVTKKSRVTIGITDKNAPLSNGSYVEVAIVGGEIKNDSQNVATSTKKDITIPISAIKVLPRGFSVFTVSEENTIVAHMVKEGAILGSRIIILEGLSEDMSIITDVRGLSEGDVVSIQDKDVTEN